MTITIEISAGELVDRLTILEIKRERIADPAKRRNVEHELALTVTARDRALPGDARLVELTGALREVNARLWQIEDDIRDCERRREFGPRFVELARSVYKLNDERADVKKRINTLLGSALVEEKSYQPY
jgi:hypothetical protein